MPDDMDWRLQGVMPGSHPSLKNALGDGASEDLVILVDAVKLERNRLLAFPIPNATAMLLNASKRAFVDAQRLMAHESLEYAPRGFVQFHTNADAIDFAEHLTISIVLAYSSLECFANEFIPPWITYKNKGKKGDAPKVLSKEEMEKVLKLGEKFAVVLPAVFGVVSPRGTAIWEQFVKLEKVRNRVVHMKDADRAPGDLKADTVWKAMLTISSPYQTAKLLIDHFLAATQHVPGLVFDNLRPVRPRWHVESPPDTAK